MLLAALSLLLSKRWPVLHVVYGALVAVVGFFLAVTGDAFPKRMTTAPRVPAAYRLTGLLLVAWGGFLVFFQPPPYRLLNSAAIGVFAAAIAIVVLTMRRRPELSPFGDQRDAPCRKG